MIKKSSSDRGTRGGGRLLGRLKGVSCALVGIAILSGQGWASEHLAMPDDARVMTGVELYMLYHGKSWKWGEGAGRLQDDGRVFTAWSGSGESATWAEGRWIVTDSGRLCLQAEWHTRTGVYPDRTCFSHRIHDGVIYQKKEPSGAWYVFKNSEPAEGDEFKKLVRGDVVSEKLQSVRISLQTAANLGETPLATGTLNGEPNGEVR